jgi:co-chaperonin GroES (HSP10)
VRAKLREIAEGSISDPKKALLDSVGDLSWITLYGQRVVVATYIQPAITRGGIHLPERTLTENRFQGKIGLVLKVGQVPDPPLFEEGDFVMYRASDGLEMFILDANGDGTPCRVLWEEQVICKVDDPAKIW